MLTSDDIKLIGEEMGRVIEDNVSPQFDMIHKEIAGMKGEIVGMKGEIVGMKSAMVTKHYLDEKLGRVDGKINSLINVLHTKNIIDENDKQRVLA